MKDAIWVTWEHQLRNKSMSSALGIPLRVIDYKGTRLIRYIICMIRTLILLVRERPSVVFAQNPSIVLNYFLLILKHFFRYRLVSDAHFGGIEAFNGSRLFQIALDLNNRFADAVIVTNDDHARRVEKIGGKAFVCEDPLPDIVKYSEPSDEGVKIVFFICSYDIDEPFKVAFDAAKILASEGYKFYVSGNYHKANIDAGDYPHINFLGFVAESEFYYYLFKSQLVLDLTTHENCLVCGAYEAMAAGRPLVTSNRAVLKWYFNRGTVFTEHDAQNIASSIRYAYDHRDDLRKDILEWKSQAIADNNEKIRKIVTFLQQGI
jgi:glycosyltransferase involved in cell wall biosynthesis